ncbi:hypothetical protein QTN25_001246 [Entamoeba marina]
MEVKTVYLESFYLMNVILYSKLDVIPLLEQVSHSCQTAVLSMRINPWNYDNVTDANKIVKRIYQMFPRIETLQIDSLSLQNVQKSLIDKIKMIRLVKPNFETQPTHVSNRLTSSNSLNNFNAQKLYIGYYDFKTYCGIYQSFKHIKYIKVVGCQGEEINLQDINKICNDPTSIKNDLHITLHFRVVTQKEYDYVAGILNALPNKVSVTFMDSINIGFESIALRDQSIHYLNDALNRNIDVAQKYYLPFNLSICKHQQFYDLTPFTFLQNIAFTASDDFGVSLPVSIKNMMAFKGVKATVTNLKELKQLKIFNSSTKYEAALLKNRID